MERGMEMVKQVALYCRISNLDPRAQATLDHQEKWGHEEAVRLECKVVGVYKDQITGTVESRPELDRLRADIPARGIEGVFVYSDDRLAREHNVLINLVQEFDDLGAPIHFGNVVVGDLSDADGWLMFSIRGLLVEWERKKVVQRLSRGATAARQRGVLFSKLPNHFRQVDGGVIVPDEAALDMFNSRELGETIARIAERHRTYLRDVSRTIERVRE